MSRVKIPDNFPFPSHIVNRRRDFKLCWFLIQTIGVATILPSEFYSDNNAHMGENFLRFAICKEDHVLEVAKERVRALREYFA
jgi:kynurenine aminotransferase